MLPAHIAFHNMNTGLCALVVLLALVVGITLWATETPADRARRWHRAGISQRQIALRLEVSRHRVRGWLQA
jgi:hypothetical protein